ncbi:non-ribosomal peptide synthetase [Clostridium botulinum]|uniref:non-ribosomal peptide synthetase n=1 Tax=Clostridium botulinum TaxID=1491 RepID=UPI001966E806|nr:non-ribosomal peptide synthetase [Clostridium botulinum]MBN1050268.1 amino acid adenylation domain-containing protein [Clostridium botulinum]
MNENISKNIISNMMNGEKEFWTNKICKDFSKTILPCKNTKWGDKNCITVSNFYIRKNDTFKIKSICKDSTEKIFMFLYSAITVLIYKYTNNKYVTIESPIFRQDKEKNVINKLIPFIQEVSEEFTFKELLLSSISNVEKSYNNGNYPFEKICDLVNEFLGEDQLPLSDISFVLDNLQNVSYVEESKDKIIFIFSLEDKCISLNIKYDESTYSKYFIENLFRNFEQIISNILELGDIKIRDIDVLSKDERNKLLIEFNNTDKEHLNTMTINEAFEIQVEKTPEKIALVFNNIELTYKELNERANIFARVLRKEGVSKESIVGIIIGRSPEMIISILAILKAGAGYLPIDPNYPIERINYMLKDSKAKLVITEGKYIEKINNLCKIIDICKETWNGNCENLNRVNDENNLAYLIYTSGSTGTPKGVMIEHKNVINFIDGVSRNLIINNYSSILCITTISFDIFVLETLLPLTNGLKVILADENQQIDGQKLSQLIESNSVDIIQSTPSRMNVLMENDDFNKIFHSIRMILLGGEQLTITLLQRLNKYNNLSIFNMYGPTETTVWSTMKKIDGQDKVTIGFPIQNTKIFMVNEGNKLQPIGVPGELCISGDGVARGYLNNSNLTSEKFVSNPFEINKRMYKTGDLAKWLPNGEIEILGRIDHQVKIRGFRIELGEIETAILKLTGIKEVTVLAKGDDEKYLCAFYVSEVQHNKLELKSELKKFIPEYMIPSYFIQVENIPLTPNGKIDRLRLLKINEEIDKEVKYEDPIDPLEKKLVNLYEDILKINNVGINHNFFDIGGNSLNATILVGRIHRELNVEIPLREIFNLGTIKELSEYINAKEISAYKKIEKVSTSKYYIASSAQKRMYMLQELDKENTAYNIPGAIEFNEKLDIQKVKNTLLTLIDRHEILRTQFDVIDGEVVQIVKKIGDVDFDIKELNVDDENELNKVLIDFAENFNLSKTPLIKVGVIRIKDMKEILVYDMHHIISDGVSMSIMSKEFIQLYEGKELPPLKVQYKDYCNWQRNLKSSREYENQQKYWMNKLDRDIPVLNIATDFSRPMVQQFDGQELKFKLDKCDTNKLKALAKETRTTMYMILLSAFNILLSKYSGQDDIIVGTPVSGRNHPDLENVIGLLVNTLAIRSKIDFEKSYLDFLNDIKSNTLEAFDNQDYQFEELLEQLDLYRDISRNPLFDVMFSWGKVENIDSITQYNFYNNIAKFDIDMTAIELNDEIYLNIQYATSLFKRETIEKMSNHYINILKTLINNKQIKLKDIDILTRDEKLILNNFNNNYKEIPKDTNVILLFEEQVEKSPNKIAVKCNDKKLTYKQLNDKSNKLARLLRKNGVGRNKVVSVMMERSIDMLVSILSILKAGGAYVPIDIEYSDERIRNILNDSRASIALVNNETIKYKESILETHTSIINVNSNLIDNEGEGNLDNINEITDLAYVLFTSGSTGKPKGVMIEHLGLLNHILAMKESLNLSEESRIAQNASHCFDVSVWQFLTAITVGGRILIYPKDSVLDVKNFIEKIEEDKVTVLEVVPTYLSTMLDFLEEDRRQLINLQYLLITGETLIKKLVKRWFDNYKHVKVVNAYGPAEASDDTTLYIMDKLCDHEVVPIGKSVQNVKHYVVDRYMNLCPIGVVGELCVSGIAVGKGYINNEEKTKLTFIEDPFTDERGIRLYKTGDLARWLPSGDLEFIGREDYQVKIRGFRIELGEIESQMLKFEFLKEAVVTDMVNKYGSKYLSAYFVSDNKVDIEKLRKYLKEILPEYMIPSHFTQLDKFPLSSNGKISRRDMPEPKVDMDDRITKYATPRNEIEKLLVEIWKEVLGVDQIGIDDDFFELGGESIKAIRIISKLNKNKYVLDIKDLFANSNIRDVSQYISIDLENKLISQKEVVGQAGLTPIQKWFFNQNFKEMNHWNQSVMLYRKDRFEEKLIIKVFNTILKHHDALRMVFKNIDGQIHQFNRENADNLFELKIFNYLEEFDFKNKIKEECELLQKSLNLWSGDLVKLGLFKTSDGDYLAIIIHHLIIDGVSWRILFEDFAIGYEQLLNKEEIDIQEKCNSYLDWQKALEEYSYSKELLNQVDYWNKLLDVETKELCVDRKINTKDRLVKNNEIIKLTFDKEHTRNLLKNANKSYNTNIDDLLITALMISINKWCGNDTVIVNMEGHGRQSIGKLGLDINRTIGWFTAEYPLILKLDTNRDVGYNIKNIKETLRSVPDKGVGYNILKYNRNDIFTKKVNPEISFNYLGDFDSDLNNSIFDISEVSTGSAISENAHMLYKFDINAGISKGTLIMAFEYNTNEFKYETVKDFMNNYKECLCSLIDHCVNKEEVDVTPSDISNYNISIEQLDIYKNSIEILEQEDKFLEGFEAF